MLPKIRYRLVYNYANRLNGQGLSTVAVECRQGQKKVYFSSNVTLYPNQWCKGMVVNHSKAEKLTAYLVKWRNEIEEIELNALLKGHRISLCQLKTAVKSGIHENASLREFTHTVIENSDRKESTRRGYEYLMNEIEREYGKLTLDDITYDWVTRWRTHMQETKLSENTIKGRMKLLRCVMNEAIKRNIIQDNPFKFIKIGNMTAKKVYLEMKEIKRIEKLELKGKEAIVRDLFLLGCYSGLRWSDLSTLERAEIKNGILRKTMLKTSHEVVIPIGTLFWGKGMEIIERYKGNITRLSHVCSNATANRTIKEIAERAGVKKNVSFHWARKSCSSNLLLLGMDRNEISSILGHASLDVTEKHYLFSKNESAIKSSKKIFRPKVGK